LQAPRLAAPSQAPKRVGTGESQARRVVGNVWLLTVRGEHDESTAPELRRALADLRRWGRRVVVDCSAASFVGSSTLAAIRDDYTDRGRRGFVIVAPERSAMRTLLNLSRFRNHFPVFETVTGALVALQRSTAPEVVETALGSQSHDA
jgi:anti-anti-sigma factor